MSAISRFVVGLLAFVMALFASVSHAVMAQPVLTDLVTYVETGFTTVSVLALAVLTFMVGMKLYKWARKAT